MIIPKTRLKRLRRISPFNGYHFKETPSSKCVTQRSSEYRSIYAPKYDTPKHNIVLTNMRNSEHYLRSQIHFEKPFMEHIEKTGYDNVGIVCKREFELEKQKRRKKFGSEEDMIMWYPGKRPDVDGLEEVEKVMNSAIGKSSLCEAMKGKGKVVGDEVIEVKDGDIGICFESQGDQEVVKVEEKKENE